jgi:hypothetical protein
MEITGELDYQDVLPLQHDYAERMQTAWVGR